MKTKTFYQDLCQILRASLTGRTVSPPIFDIMYILGKNETLKRIKNIIDIQGENNKCK